MLAPKNKREIHTVAEPVREIEFRNGVEPIILAQLQDALGEIARGGQHVAVAVHGRLGRSGAARGVEEKRNVVRCGRMGLHTAVFRVQPIVQRHDFARDAFRLGRIGFGIDDHQQVERLGGCFGRKLADGGSVHQRHPRAAVRKVVAIITGPCMRIDGNRDHADFCRAKKCRDKLRRIGQHDQHPVARLAAGKAQRLRHARGEFVELSVGIFASGTEDRDAIGMRRGRSGDKLIRNVEMRRRT